MELRDQAFAGQPLTVPVIDAHTHILGYCNIGWYQSIRTNEQVIALMDHLGIDAIVTCPHSLVIGDMELTNETTAQAAKDFPGRIYGYIAVCPQYGIDRIRTNLETYSANAGFVGLKFLPGYHGSLACPAYDFALDFAAERRCPVLSHVWGGNPPFSEIEQAVKKRPSLKLVMAHQGGGASERTDEYAQLMKTYPNLYMEICGSLYNRYSLEDMVARAGEDRVIFGSDLINVDPRFDLGRVVFSTLPDVIKKKILSENFLKLLQDSAMGKIRL